MRYSFDCSVSCTAEHHKEVQEVSQRELEASCRKEGSKNQYQIYIACEAVHGGDATKMELYSNCHLTLPNGVLTYIQALDAQLINHLEI